MDLTIVIVSFNTRVLTLDCVRSIISSKPKVKYEIIVVDNASSDGSIEALNKFKTSNRLGAKLRIVESRENLGFAKANNIGIKSAHGRYVFLLNSDTKVRKGSIDNLYKFAKGKIDAGVVGPKLLNADGSVQSSVSRLPTIYRAVSEYFFGYKLFSKYAPQGEDVSEVESIVGAAFLMTPKAISEVGLLDERYFMYFEDLDYCRKVREKDLKVYYVPQSQIIHYHGASGGKSDLLIASSKVYHGLVRYWIITFILWSGQKINRLR